MPRLAAAAVAVAALIAVFSGAMYLRDSGDGGLAPELNSSSERALLKATDCRLPDESRHGVPISDSIFHPIEPALAIIRFQNPCNRPDASTAQATRTTWDTASRMVQERGGFIPKNCTPQCQPDDTTKTWLVEVHGSFVAPPEGEYGSAMVPDSGRGPASPTRPVAGTWFQVIPVLNY